MTPLNTAMEQEREYKRGSRVVLVDAIPSVPEGTGGKTGRALGFAQKRYRVRFDNKTEAMSVAHDMLVPEKEWPKLLANREAEHEQQALARAHAAETEAQPVAPLAADTAAAASASTTTEDDSPDPRLAKLLERSQSARKDSGVPSPTAEPEQAKASEPEQAVPATSGKKPETSNQMPVVHVDPPAANIEVTVPEKFVPGPEIDAKNYRTNDRVFELLSKIRNKASSD